MSDVHVQTPEEMISALVARCKHLQEENLVLRAKADAEVRRRAVEHYYSVQSLALLLEFTPRWVREVFADHLVPCGSDDRIPASAVNAYLATRRDVKRQCTEATPARTVGELRRKVAA